MKVAVCAVSGAFCGDRRAGNWFSMRSGEGQTCSCIKVMVDGMTDLCIDPAVHHDDICAY